MSYKEEYQIPGLGNVGTVGNRNPTNVGAISQVFNDYNAKKGVVIEQNGMMHGGSSRTAQELLGDQGRVTVLQENELSMGNPNDDAQFQGNPYHLANPRRDSLIPPLKGKRVTIVGLGGGAPIPIELLKCGVDTFRLVDHDILEAANAIRHPCPQRFFGLPKVEAARAFMLELAGDGVDIETYQFDVFDHCEEMKRMIRDSDLLVVATDSEASRHYLNEIAVEAGVPAVYVGMYKNGSGGEIFAAVPGQACYACLSEHCGREKFLKAYTAVAHKNECVSARDVSAMPGLGIDQGILALIAARKSLDVLLSGMEHSLPPAGGNWITFSLFGIPKILESSLTSFHGDLTKHQNCFACGSSS